VLQWLWLWDCFLLFFAELHTGTELL